MGEGVDPTKSEVICECINKKDLELLFICSTEGGRGMGSALDESHCPTPPGLVAPERYRTGRPDCARLTPTSDTVAIPDGLRLPVCFISVAVRWGPVVYRFQILK